MADMLPKFKYVLSTFNRIFGLDGSLDIHYGVDCSSRVQIETGAVDYFESKSPFDPSRVIWKEWRGTRIPFLFDREDRDILVSRDGCAIIQFDIIAAAFYFLSGWQEFVSGKRDSIGRFPYEESLQARLGLIEIPVVNYYFDILRSAIESSYSMRLSSRTWSGHPFATVLTHDVDKCEKGWREDAFHALRGTRPAEVLRILGRRLRGDAWFNFRQILALEQLYGAHSSFYFLPVRGTRAGLPNADYDVTHAKFRRVFEDIEKAGSEVGLHAGGGSHTDLSLIRRDLARLPGRIVGGRFHFLGFDVVRTPELLAEAGLRYDSTLGFPERFGFRSGLCSPFFLYDVVRDRPTEVVEIPLILMDTTLQHRQYMNLRPESAFDRIVPVMEEVRKFGGCLTVLWHNNYFTNHKYHGWRSVFEEILRYSRSAGGALVSGAEALQWHLQELPGRDREARGKDH